MRNGHEEKNGSDEDSHLAVVLLLRVRSCQFDKFDICHRRAVLSAQLGQKCRMCQSA